MTKSDIYYGFQAIVDTNGHCRVPTIHLARKKRHCRVLYIVPAQPELISISSESGRHIFNQAPKTAIITNDIMSGRSTTIKLVCSEDFSP